MAQTNPLFAGVTVRRCGARALIFAPLLLIGSMPAQAEDAGKKACYSDAKRLCQHEMHTLSRKRVQACLIVHMEQTSPPCHAFMVQARAAALSGKKPDASAQ